MLIAQQSYNGASETSCEEAPRNAAVVQCRSHGHQQGFGELAGHWSLVDIRTTHMENVRTKDNLLTTRERRILLKMRLFPGVEFI